MQSAPRPDTGARFLMFAASLVVVVAGLKLAAGLLVPLMVSVFVATITLPLLNLLRVHGVPTPLAVLATLLAIVVVLGAIGWLVGGSIAAFTAEVPTYRAQLRAMIDNVLGWLSARGLPVDERLSADMLDPSALFDVATGALRGIAGVISNVLLILLTIVFILFEAAGFPAKLQAAFGDAGSSARYERIKSEVQRYLAIKTSISLATGVTIGAAMWLLGVDFPFLWGLTAFVLNYIPSLGSIFAAIPPTLLALLQNGPATAIGVAAVFAIVNVSLGNFLEPTLMGRRLGMSTLVVFLSLVFWGWVWGPVGMLLSVPLTMIVKIMLENTPDLRWVAVLLSGQADAASSAPGPVAAPGEPPAA